MARQGREPRTERDDQRMDRSEHQNQRGNQQDDSTSSAPESGEPEEAGRSRGQVLDEKGNVKRPAPTGSPRVDESGRHQATPD